jgi:DHA2 family methylenomycin A resistance protein-like MFS transporter
MASGPLLGGALVALLDWRAVFAVNVVVGIPAALWALGRMPTVPRRDRRLDIAGMVAGTALVGGLVFALIEAPGRHWASPAVLTALALATGGLAAFVHVERSAAAPVLPLRLYADRLFATTVVQGALFNYAFYGVLFSLGLMLQEGRGLGAMTSGLMFLPLTGLISLGTVAVAPLVPRIGRRAILAAGQAMLMLSLLAVAWAGTAEEPWPLALALLPAGFSSGLQVPTMTSRAIESVEPALHGAASAALNTARQIGGALGVATFGPVLGAAQDFEDGFTLCVLVAAAAIAGAFLITLVGGYRLRATRELSAGQAERSKASSAGGRTDGADEQCAVDVVSVHDRTAHGGAQRDCHLERGHLQRQG